MTQLNVYSSWVESLIPLFSMVYIGTLVDSLGRKKVMYIYLTASIASSVVTVLNSAFFLWPKEYTLLNKVPLLLMGGLDTWQLCMFAFLADITTPDKRATRFAMISLAHMVGQPLSPLIGAALFDWGNNQRANGKILCMKSLIFFKLWMYLRHMFETWVFLAGYVTVEVANFVLNCLVFVILYGSIRRFEWKQTGNSVAPPLLRRAWDAIVDFFMTAVKDRQEDIKKILWILLATLVMLMMASVGTRPIEYQYTYLRYHWQVDEKSTFSTYDNSLKMVGLLLFPPLVNKKLKLRNVNVLLFVLSTNFIQNYIVALAPNGTIYYIGK